MNFPTLEIEPVTPEKPKKYRLWISIEEQIGDVEPFIEYHDTDFMRGAGSFLTLEEAVAQSEKIESQFDCDQTGEKEFFDNETSSPLKVHNVLKVADIFHGDITEFTKRLILSSDEAYTDKNEAMNENIFDIEETMDFIHSLIEATPGSYEHTLPEFEAIERLCQENECGCFRIINSI